jgi:DNA-binding NtrC family response regulator
MANCDGLLSILVVDDERTVADTLAAVLRHHNYDASAAYSAEEALVWCSGKCLDVVITDVVMGRMNGIELAVYLAQTAPECRVLIVSGHLDTLLVQMAKGHKFPILAKPIQPREILAFLATIQDNGDLRLK